MLVMVQNFEIVFIIFNMDKIYIFK